LRFTRFNFEWNGFDKPTLVLGNINEPSGRAYDESGATPKPWKELLGNSATYIVSNPPFLPVPVHEVEISSRYGLFSSGGSTGEEFFENLVRLASGVLDRDDPSATLAVVSEFMNPDADFDLRLSSWWDDVGSARALLLTNEVALSATVYAQRRADDLEEASQWEEHLRREGITSVSPGLAFLKRNPMICRSTPGSQDNSDSSVKDDGRIVELTHYLVPKTHEGSIWTPTNHCARSFTRHQLEEFSLL